MGNIGTWQLVIVLAIVLLLFGAKRLPDAARGLGRSLKIFKSETQGLVSNNDDNDKDAGKDDAEGPAQETAGKPKAVETSSTGEESQQGEVVSDTAPRRDA